MIFDKEYFDIISQDISVEDYENFECREIIKIMNRLYSEDEEVDEELLFKKVKEIPNIDVKLIDNIRERRVNCLPEYVHQMIKDLISTLEINKLEAERNSIKKEIEEMEKREDNNSIEEERFLKLCMELTDLNKELNLIRYEEGR